MDYTSFIKPRKEYNHLLDMSGTMHPKKKKTINTSKIPIISNSQRILLDTNSQSVHSFVSYHSDNETVPGRACDMEATQSLVDACLLDDDNAKSSFNEKKRTFENDKMMEEPKMDPLDKIKKRKQKINENSKRYLQNVIRPRHERILDWLDERKQLIGKCENCNCCNTKDLDFFQVRSVFLDNPGSKTKRKRLYFSTIGKFWALQHSLKKETYLNFLERYTKLYCPMCLSVAKTRKVEIVDEDGGVFKV